MKVNVGLRNIFCSVQKEHKGWWKRLLKLNEKAAPYIKVDWNRWCDEDEEESSNCKLFCFWNFCFGSANLYISTGGENYMGDRLYVLSMLMIMVSNCSYWLITIGISVLADYVNLGTLTVSKAFFLLQIIIIYLGIFFPSGKKLKKPHSS